jgi:hypothetical protein
MIQCSSKRFPAPHVAIALWRTAILNTLQCGDRGDNTFLLILWPGIGIDSLSDCDRHQQLPRGFTGIY